MQPNNVDSSTFQWGLHAGKAEPGPEDGRRAVDAGYPSILAGDWYRNASRVIGYIRLFNQRLNDNWRAGYFSDRCGFRHVRAAECVIAIAKDSQSNWLQIAQVSDPSCINNWRRLTFSSPSLMQRRMLPFRKCLMDCIRNDPFSGCQLPESRWPLLIITSTWRNNRSEITSGLTTGHNNMLTRLYHIPNFYFIIVIIFFFA